mmetsp:Transcript_100669/g.324813  ORF Transcript_100669/g.324813 Transcript_100669/m.324813 type:complete len:256 (+) Transcript_100669:49-816(+)
MVKRLGRGPCPPGSWPRLGLGTRKSGRGAGRWMRLDAAGCWLLAAGPKGVQARACLHDEDRGPRGKWGPSPGHPRCATGAGLHRARGLAHVVSRERAVFQVLERDLHAEQLRHLVVVGRAHAPAHLLLIALHHGADVVRPLQAMAIELRGEQPAARKGLQHLLRVVVRGLPVVKVADDQRRDGGIPGRRDRLRDRGPRADNGDEREGPHDAHGLLLLLRAPPLDERLLGEAAGQVQAKNLANHLEALESWISHRR